MQSTNRQRIVGKISHDLNEVHYDQMMVLALDQTLVQWQVLILLRYYQIGTIWCDSPEYLDNIIERIQLLRPIELGSFLGCGVGFVANHGHGKCSKLTNCTHCFWLCAPCDSTHFNVHRDLSDGKTGQCQQNATSNLYTACGQFA